MEAQKKGPGRKTIKQHRDENAQKYIAMGTQNPIETYILCQSSKETAHKEHGGRASLRITHAQ